MYRKLLRKHTGIEKVVPDHPESIVAPVHLDVGAAAPRVGMRFGNPETKVEKREEDVRTIGNVIPAAFPLPHGLLQDTSGIKIGIEVVAFAEQTVQPLLRRIVGLEIQQVLIGRPHVEKRCAVLELASTFIAVKSLIPLIPNEN